TIGVGLEPHEVNGFMVTNAPFVRPLPFGSILYGATLAPDWEVETYVDGQLVSADSTDARGRFSHRLPVVFGNNPVDFIAYGPHGEQQEFQQLFQVSAQDFLPGGDFEYGLSAGRCVTTDCRAEGDLDLRYGITPRVSAQSGLDWLRDSLGRASAHPYAALALLPVNPVSFRLQWQDPGEGTVTGSWQPNVDQSLGVEVARFGEALNNPLVTTVPEQGHATLEYYWRPSWDGRTTYLTIDGLRSVRTGSVFNDARVTTGIATAVGTFLPYIEHDLTTYSASDNAADNVVGLNVLLSSMRTLGWLGEGVAFGGIQRETSGIWSGGITFGFQVSASVRIETGSQWTAGARGPVLTLRALSNLPQARTITTASAGPRRDASQFVAGSVLADDHGGGVTFIAGPELQRAGVGGRVYLDQNADGMFDGADIPLPNVLVRVGTAYTVTDSGGQYRVWDVAPFEPVPVAVDASSLENPLWVSDVRHAILHPWPNRLQTYDVAIVPGGVLEGSVLDGRTANAPAIAGVRLILKQADGTRTLETTTFTDGSYSFLGVAPGQWQLAVDPRDLTVLHGSAAPAQVTIRAVSDGDRVSASITVVPRG
ncbi:MAG TPA: hypothetical protein VMH39_11905, partial [Gemmatimonadaceae bacterium]|nr:hypothetical protein [Gemmatimonadaceae bacterium]